MEFQAYIYSEFRNNSYLLFASLTSYYVFHSAVEGLLLYNKKLLVPKQWLYPALSMIGQEKNDV